MGKRLIFGVIGFVLISACKQGAPTNEQVDIFDKKQIAELITNKREKQKNALQKYEKGLLKFRKENNPAEACGWFTESIIEYPTPKAYFELGNAYASRQDYGNAVECYLLAEQLGFTPVSKLFYNLACAYSLQEKNSTAAEYLEYAIEAGYLNKEQITKDPDLKNLRQWGITSMFRSAMQGVENADHLVWEGFLQTFPALVLPLTLDINSSKQLDDDRRLDYGYETYVAEMRTREKFSRGTGNLYYATGIAEQTSNYVAVVYAEIPDAEMGDVLPARYFLVSYDKKGILIDKLQIGGQKTLNDPFKACTIAANLAIEINNFTNTYKSTVDENENEHLEIVTSELKSTQYYKINENGKFMETGAPLGSVNSSTVNGSGS